MDPYLVCNEHLIRKDKHTPLPTLKQLCTKELSKRLSGPDIDKLIVQADKRDRRNTDMEKFLCALELQRKIAIVIPKLDKDLINLWTKKVPSWQELDPNASLEEDNNSASSSPDKSKSHSSMSSAHDASHQDAPFSKKGGHALRPRKHIYASSRECRTGTDVKFYHGMCEDNQPKKRCSILSRLKGPSNIRLAAQ